MLHGDAPCRLALTLLVACLSTLSGCNQQRPIHVIRAAAEAAYDKGDYELARLEYEQLVERYPGDPTARYGLGMSCLMVNDPMKAREQLAIAYEVGPTRDEVIDAYCVLLYEAKEQDTLMTFLRRLSLEDAARSTTSSASASTPPRSATRRRGPVRVQDRQAS